MESKHHRDHLPVTLDNASAAEMSTVERLKHASEGLFYVHSTHESRHTMRSEIDALSARAGRDDQRARERNLQALRHLQTARAQRERQERRRFHLHGAGQDSRAASSRRRNGSRSTTAADRYADGSIRLTARQGVQFHYVRGHNLSPLIRHINAQLSDNGYQLTTLGACGDVNRNTVASPIDDLDAELPLDSHELAHAVAREMAPRSSAYYQVFLADQNGQQVAPLNSEEPIYGAQYLPRKFKVGFAHPHDNSVDLLTQDVGFLPRVSGREVTATTSTAAAGWARRTTSPRRCRCLRCTSGVVQRDQVVDTVRAIATMQREHGERRNRRAARWKYTIRRLGVDAVKQTLRERFGIALEDAEPAPLPPVRDHLGMASGSRRRRIFFTPES